MTETLDQVPDARLIAAVREGDSTAFATLYERHLPSARRAAACLARSAAEREDLVAEAFTRVLRMLREGRGPDEEFRPYLLVTLRNAAIHNSTRGVPTALYADVPETHTAEDYVDPVIDRWNAGAAAEAFASLPERWRMVLWHTEVEGESPAQVAPLLGMRPNSVAALAYRAREGLRQAYLRRHVSEPPRPECRSVANKLAGYVRQNIPAPLSRKIAWHLENCAECRSRVQVLSRINEELGGLLAPVVLGGPLAAAYAHAPVAAGALTASAAADAGLAAGFLATKAALLKVGTAVAIAATAVTTTAATPPPTSGKSGLAVSAVDADRRSSHVAGTPSPSVAARPDPDGASPTGQPPGPETESVVPTAVQVEPGGEGEVTTGAPVPTDAAETEQDEGTDARAQTKAERKAEKKAEKQQQKAGKPAKNKKPKSEPSKAKGKPSTSKPPKDK
ncbi:sigma-70 family RNA polymerase sigma factor [Actinophytocola xanthii]|uniref:sigma-70 family RNA polymerase sigma factor n=1 Tax=Actinophytocola xanthii TaxID=1912961 RepID=UPI00130133C6|nr:sigma-70 family RNA polymerase sigma factor [Actinophytocola xanthii]